MIDNRLSADERVAAGSSATFEVRFDRSRSMLIIRLNGFFSVKDVEALAKERDAALVRLGCAPNQHVTLCDARGGLPSSPEVADAFQRILGNPKSASRRLAYIADGAITRYQAKRVLGRADLQFFTDTDEAEAWLLGEVRSD